MARCEDAPCCGHEPGTCPDRDEDGRPVYRCECGAPLQPRSRSSLCRGCIDRLLRGDDGD